MLIFLTTAPALALGAVALAGELDPPAGPPAPTFKTLDEVEPRIPLANDPDGVTPIVIVDPGSYYLTENIYPIPGNHGIVILGENITLDMRGFAILGNLETPSLDGINAAIGTLNISIYNGVVSTAGQDGVDLQGAVGSVVRDVRVSNCIADGIVVGISGRVENCVSWGNGDDGFSTGAGSVITSSTAYNNGDVGIQTSQNNSVSNCTAYSNGGNGFWTGFSTVVSNCAAFQNTNHGFEEMGPGVFSDCSAVSNAGSGFRSTAGSVFNNCNARSNTVYGFQVQSGLIRGCFAINNTLANSSLLGTVVFESSMP